MSWRTANRWARRFAEMGSAGMLDRSSRPHRSPARTPPSVVKKIVHLRWKKRLGPVQIGGVLELPASTVHAVLVCCRLNRLSHLDVRTGEPVRRYEHDTPSSLIHVELIVERVNAGIAAARANGTRFGRPLSNPAVIEDKLAIAGDARARGRTAEDAARLVGRSRATLYRHQQTHAARGSAAM